MGQAVAAGLAVLAVAVVGAALGTVPLTTSGEYAVYQAWVLAEASLLGAVFAVLARQPWRATTR